MKGLFGHRPWCWVADPQEILKMNILNSFGKNFVSDQFMQHILGKAYKRKSQGDFVFFYDLSPEFHKGRFTTGWDKETISFDEVDTQQFDWTGEEVKLINAL